jgi:predicted HAD superfamily hydrolase
MDNDILTKFDISLHEVENLKRDFNDTLSFYKCILSPKDPWVFGSKPLKTTFFWKKWHVIIFQQVFF